MHDALDNGNHALKRIFRGYRAYLCLFAGLFIFYLILSPFITLTGNSGALNLAWTPYDGDARVMLAMALLLIALLAAALTVTARKKMTAELLAAFLISAGVILRFGYMLYTPFYIRGHDVMAYGGYGHLDYIFRLFNREGLPTSYGGQFYHPPLAHLADAAVARLYAFITGSAVPDTIFESSRLVPCFASCALLLMCSRLFDALDFRKTAKAVALAVIAFHPTFILLSASINNDMLMILFFMAAFLFTVHWYKEQTYRSILFIALSIGLAMSTKFSGALIAAYTAVVFLLVLIRRIRERKPDGLLGQYAAFVILCFPLGLWYQYRNLSLFGQKLGYVAEIPRTSALFVGNLPAAERFLTLSLPDMLKYVYCNPFEDHRLWEYAVKCALFGEFTFSAKHDLMARILIVSSLVLIVLSLIATVWFLFFDRKKNRLAVLSFAAVWALLMASFVYFNIKYPFGCTMDFRYIAPTVVTGAAFLGLLYDRLPMSRSGALLKGVFIGVLAVFCAASAVFYII